MKLPQKRYSLLAVLTIMVTVAYFLTSKNNLAEITSFNKLVEIRPKVLTNETFSSVGCQSFEPPPFPLPVLSSRFGTTFWRCLFPDLADLLSSIERNEVIWPVGLLETTEPHSTTIQLERTIYKVGETVTGFIQAKNYKGKNKSYGGDHFRARLVRLSSDGRISDDVAPCIVTYQSKGRYLLQTFVPWPGTSVLIVELVHSSESLIQLVKASSTYVHPYRISGLQPLNADKTQVIECDVGLRNRSSNSPVCDYSNKLRGVTWVCSKHDNASCPTEYLYVVRKKILPKIREFDRPVEIQNSGKLTITSIAAPPYGHPTLGKSWTKSGIATESKSMVSAGYYSNQKWVSLAHSGTVRKLSDAKKCLKGKTVYLLGDSTMRQWFISLNSALGLKDVHSPLAASCWSMPRRGVDESGLSNTSLYYFAHAPPLFNPGPVESHPSLVDTIGGIRTRDPIVVFNLGAHFIYYDPVLFLQRAFAVRDAVVELNRRAPDAVILLRGAIRFSTAKPKLDEWPYMRADLILRHVFAELKFVRVIDTWEMTTCKPQRGVHANQRTIDDFLTVFLSFVC